MTFAGFQKLNARRNAESFERQHGIWSFDKYLLAMAGEVGEACNLAKKVIRGDFPIEAVRAELGKELADVICYTDLAMTSLGLETGKVVLAKFHEVSTRIGWNGYGEIRAAPLCADKGHVYNLYQLDSAYGAEVLRFVKRVGVEYPGNQEPAHSGTNVQEVCRALIDRLVYLDGQAHSWVNPVCVCLLRSVMNLLEYRAAKRHGRKFRWSWSVEHLNFDPIDGHVRY